MVLKREEIEERLKYLRSIIDVLEQHQDRSLNDYLQDITFRFAIERALTLAAEVVVDILSYILASSYATFPQTYEEAIEKGEEKGIITETLYRQLAGFGKFRNILIHLYMGINNKLVFQHWQKSPKVLRTFLAEIMNWLSSQKGDQERHPEFA